jgi:hypothetical protein
MPKGSRLHGLWAELVPLSLTSGSCHLDVGIEAAATWTKMVTASTAAHDDPNKDDIKRPIIVPILIAATLFCDARANGSRR